MSGPLWPETTPVQRPVRSQSVFSRTFGTHAFSQASKDGYEEPAADEFVGRHCVRPPASVEQPKRPDLGASCTETTAEPGTVSAPPK
jgi:hypothetical protein